MTRKRDNFVRLAENRVNRALREIRLIGNLSNRGAYAYTESDVRSIFKTLQRELDAAKARFTGDNGLSEREFRLSIDA